MSADASSVVVYGVLVEDADEAALRRACVRLGADVEDGDDVGALLASLAARYRLSVEHAGSMADNDECARVIGVVWSSADADTDAAVALPPRPRVSARKREALRVLGRALKRGVPRWWHVVVRT